MIRPGLERISRLLSGVQLSWKAIHVAGTNGKGSVCAYLSAMLHGAGIHAGRFTSPHLIDRWDCITIDEKPVSESVFRQVEDQVKMKNSQDSIDASEFELLTATAFQIFNEEKVRVAVVECGMGGKLDATNILSDPLVTVITAIGMDHQAFLGNTLEEIAEQKAGIMKPRVPCVINPRMEAKAAKTICSHAKTLGTPVIGQHSATADASQKTEHHNPDWEHDIKKTVGTTPRTVYQASNMWCAFKAMEISLPRLGGANTDIDQLAPIMAQASLPGRLQNLSIASVTGRREPVLLDGAHNAQAFHALASYINDNSRPLGRVTWVLAMSHGKDAKEIFQNICDEDHVVITSFGAVDGMPWVKPATPEEFDCLRERNVSLKSVPNVKDALVSATEVAQGGPLVIAGSLYLVSDVLRILRQCK